MTNQLHKLLLLIVAAIFTCNAYAYDVEIDGIYYNLNTKSQTASVTSGDDSYAGDVTIPASITHNDKAYSVTGIGEYAFSECTGLTTICIPEGVTSIGAWAFSECSGLTTISIPEGVTSIERNAFGYCLELTSIDLPSSVTSIGASAFSRCTGLTSIEIPEGVTSIGDWTFYECSGLTSIDIPSSVTSIGERAFSECSGLTSISIPSSVTSIGERAFSGCSGLTAINVSSDNPAYCSIDGILYDKEKTTLIQCPEAKTGSVSIPEGVTRIEASAFSGCSGLTAINVSSDNPAYCSIDGFLYDKDKTTLILCPKAKTGSVSIPEGVTIIEASAFSECHGLTSINIPSSVTSIGERAFSYCSGLTTINVSSDNPAYCSIDGFLYDKDKTTLILCPKAKTGSVNIPEGVTSIKASAFYGCSGLTSVNIPEGVTSIGEYAFSGCSGLTSVNIPEGVTGIEPYTFCVCSGLTSIYIPSSVTYIKEFAFTGFSGLTSIYVFNPKYPWASPYSFAPQHFESATLYVPQESVEAYQAANVWKNFQNIQGFDTTGIEGVEAEDGNRPAAYYDVNGRKSATPHHGVNIVRQSDGTTRKVMMK